MLVLRVHKVSLVKVAQRVHKVLQAQKVLQDRKAKRV